MKLEEFIGQAKINYPNGYADYISKYPNETPDRWAMTFDDGRVEKVGDYTFALKDILEMNNWEPDRFWTFIALIDYNYYNN